MIKRKKYLLIILCILVIIICTVSALIIYNFNVKSKNEKQHQAIYTQAEYFLNKDDYNDALRLFLMIQGYKDSSCALIYTNCNYILSNTLQKDYDKYSQVNDYLAVNSVLINSFPDSKYSTLLKQMHKDVSTKLEELKQSPEYANKINDLQFAVNLIKQGHYEDAKKTLDELSATSGKFGDDNIQATIAYFADALCLDQAGEYSKVPEIISNISPQYEGILSKEINSFVHKYLTLEEWVNLYNKKHGK